MKLWIAIDRYYNVTLHDVEPKTDGAIWYPVMAQLPYNPYHRKLTFQNSPMEVKLKLIEK